MSTLEQKIKALLEGTEQLDEKETITTKGGATIVDDDSKDDEDDDHSEPDGDEDGEDTDGDGDGKTKVSKDPGAEKADPQEEDDQDNPKMNEDIDPFSNKLAAYSFNDSNGGIESGAAKTAKLKVGLGKKDDAGQSGKLAAPPSTGKTDDNGDNARMTAKYQKGAPGKLSDGTNGSAGQNPVNAKNFVDDNKGEGSIDPFGTMKKNEHMEALFNGEELTEEFKTKAQTIFEAAVESAAEARFEQLQEETAIQINEAVEEVKAELVEQIDGFLNLVVEKWIDDNAVALEGSMKVDLTNSFIDGLKGLFKEHYFDIPDDRLDIVEEQASEIADLQQQVEEAVEIAESIHQEFVDLKRSSLIEGVAAELTMTEKDKFQTLAENVEYTSDEEFMAKLETIKESYFPHSQGQSFIPQSDTPVAITEEVKKSVDTYVDAIAKNIKF